LFRNANVKTILLIVLIMLVFSCYALPVLHVKILGRFGKADIVEIDGCYSVGVDLELQIKGFYNSAFLNFKVFRVPFEKDIVLQPGRYIVSVVRSNTGDLIAEKVVEVPATVEFVVPINDKKKSSLAPLILKNCKYAWVVSSREVKFVRNKVFLVPFERYVIYSPSYHPKVIWMPAETMEVGLVRVDMPVKLTLRNLSDRVIDISVASKLIRLKPKEMNDVDVNFGDNVILVIDADSKRVLKVDRVFIDTPSFWYDYY